MIIEIENEGMKNQGNSSEFISSASSRRQISHNQYFYHQQSSQQIDALKDLPPCKKIRKKQGKKTKRAPYQSQKQRGGNAKLRKEVVKETVYNRKLLNTMPILTVFENVPNQNFEAGVAMRQAHDEKISINQQQIKHKHSTLAIAQFKAIQLYEKQLIGQSIEYISYLAQKSKLSNFAKKALNEKSISHYFTQLFGEEFKTSFAKHSTGMLTDRLLEIIKQFKASKKGSSSSLRIQVEILAHFFKILFQLQEYIPQKDINLVYMEGLLKAIIKLLNIDLEQFRELKQIFVENVQQIKYFKQIKEISPLANAYYFIALKQRVVRQYSFISTDSLDATIKELMDHKAQVMQEHKYKIANCQKLSLSELYEKRTRKSKRPFQPVSVEEFIKTMEIYEELIDKYGVYIKQQQLEQIKMHYGKDFSRYQFRIYVEKKMRIHQQFKDNFDRYKNALITRQLMKNPQYSYEEMVKKIYRTASVYIKQDYFNENLFSILSKEVQYQQLKYIIRWFKLINIYKSKNISVIFLDSVSLKEEEGQESEQQVNVSPSISIAVTLKGAILCKACIKPMNEFKLLKQYSKMFEEIRPSIILLFDDQFPLPMGLEERDLIFHLRKTHTVLVLPRISLLPNPCQVIVNCLKSAFPQHLSGGEEFKKAFQGAIQKLDEKQVKKIVNKEWEKVEKIVSICGTARNDSQSEEQANRMNTEQEGQYIVEEFGRPNKYQRFQYISQQYYEGIIEQKISEEILIPPQSPEEQKSQEVKEINEVTPLPIMENLQSKSIDDLRDILAHLLSCNKKEPLFSYRHTDPNVKQIEIIFQDLGISDF